MARFGGASRVDIVLVWVAKKKKQQQQEQQEQQQQ
jgi:hypothetical protein